jgi:diketogulonate reductase-like aldo/keto reductase
MPDIARRTLLKVICTAAALLNMPPGIAQTAGSRRIVKKIPGTGEELMAVGMGTSRTFDAGDDTELRAQLQEVLQTFFDQGGQVIDTSPMYGTAETVVGDLLRRVTHKDKLFAATKVWIYGREAGIKQMKSSMEKMGVTVMDLMQIHNMRDWKTHIKTLREWKDKGNIRYFGITTSHGRDHEELVKIMKNENPDFVQFSYSLGNRDAEKDIFPVAADKNIATLINRPFQAGTLFSKVKGKPLPGWAAEIDCSSWAQVFLKYIISHDHSTCVIPATSRVSHMLDNMAAGYGRLPDADLRLRIEKDFTKL